MNTEPTLHDAAARPDFQSQASAAADGQTAPAACDSGWGLHPNADFFLQRGGTALPPPVRMELVLTDKCNLRCTICGSQSSLDAGKTPRRHMPIETFRMLARVLFPFLVEVELNSAGEPMLHPQIDEVLDTLAHYRCRYKIQHNGTLLTDGRIQRLTSQPGELLLSIDATGPLFDELRVGASWNKVEPSIRKLASLRDPEITKLSLYPTITRKSLPGMLELVRWAHELRLDQCVFHDYDPNPFCHEEKAGVDAKREEYGRIREFLSTQKSSLRVYSDSTTVYAPPMPSPLPPVESRSTALNPKGLRHWGAMYPRARKEHDSDSRYLCRAPLDSIGANLDGTIFVCCRTQTMPLGTIRSDEDFANLWFGPVYRHFRQALEHGPAAAKMPSRCADCVRQYAPDAATRLPECPTDGTIRAAPIEFRQRQKRLPITIFYRTQGGQNVYFAGLPFGTNLADYELHENEAKMAEKTDMAAFMAAPGNSYIRVDNGIHFSASDGSDPLRNGRAYALVHKDSAVEQGGGQRPCAASDEDDSGRSVSFSEGGRPPKQRA